MFQFSPLPRITSVSTATISATFTCSLANCMQYCSSRSVIFFSKEKQAEYGKAWQFNSRIERDRVRVAFFLSTSNRRIHTICAKWNLVHDAGFSCLISFSLLTLWHFKQLCLTYLLSVHFLGFAISISTVLQWRCKDRKIERIQTLTHIHNRCVMFVFAPFFLIQA